MKRSTHSLIPPLSLLLAGLFMMAATFASCSLLPVSESEALKKTQLRETELEINVKQTLLVEGQENRRAEQTLQAQHATLDAQATQLSQGQKQLTPPVQPITPLNPDEEQATQSALLTQSASSTGQAGPGTPAPVDPDELSAWMKNAKILLFEDMTARTDTIRYIKPTLEKMGLPFKDDGNATGWLKDDLAGAEEGQPWDLVIIAAENKNGAAGEFFGYVLEALDKGSSVIFEVWFLDKTFSGSASTLMSRCGIQYYGNWVKIPPSRTVLFPLDTTHPVLKEPNSGLSFTKSTNYWWDEGGHTAYDVGDLVTRGSGGDASLLLGTTAESKNSHATLTVCFGGRLILQTFSTHQFSTETMNPLWENYIYNALRARFSTLQ